MDGMAFGFLEIRSPSDDTIRAHCECRGGALSRFEAAKLDCLCPEGKFTTRCSSCLVLLLGSRIIEMHKYEGVRLELDLRCKEAAFAAASSSASNRKATW